jgi:hypothetical protein
MTGEWMLAVYYLVWPGILPSLAVSGVVRAAEKSGSRAAALHSRGQWSVGAENQVRPPSAV